MIFIYAYDFNITVNSAVESKVSRLRINPVVRLVICNNNEKIVILYILDLYAEG